MRFRRATDVDFEAILKLQDANLVWNLSEEQACKDGFLSARYCAEDFRNMNRDGALVVAEDADRIAGYACAFAQPFNAGAPLLAAMITEFPKLTFLGRPLHGAHTCIYGPVCVDRDYRGKGVLGGLVRELKEQLRGRFDLAAAFIAKSNTRSLAAHVDGLGMTVVGDFRFDGKPFWIVAFGIPPGATSCGF